MANTSAEVVWKNLVEHVSRGERATEILREIYYQIGSYPLPSVVSRSEHNITPETWQEILRFFNFDDSE
jgi:hypothetical protein